MTLRFDDLLTAFEMVNFGESGHFQAVVCKKTGKIFTREGFSDEWLDEDVPDDVEQSDQYLPLPDKRDLDLGTPLVFKFVREFLVGDYDEVDRIFSKKGAYGRFKALLERRQALDRWYEYEGKATEKALREWCAENGIELAD